MKGRDPRPHARPRRRGRRPRGIRLRTTLVATVVVGAALGSSAVGLVTIARHAVHENVRDSAALYAADLAGDLNKGRRPAELTVPDQDEMLVQILARDGSVVRSSPGLAGRTALARPGPGHAVDVGRPTGDDRMLAVAAETADRRYTVLVARSVDVVGEATAAVILALAVGLPVLLLVVAGATWRAVGRTLRPVERIRREVEAISIGELHRRVPMGQGGDEIEDLAATMNLMLERLEHGQETMRRFVADASHELRSPVAAIRQHVEVALAHPDRVELAALAATVHEENLRVQQLIEDLLLLAHGDSAAALPEDPVDLDDLVFAEAKRLKSGTALRIDTTAVGAGRVNGDARALGRVLRNLGDNAARHAVGRVAFSLSESNGSVLATVEDDGPGIAAGERTRVFERFVRLDHARTRDGGGSGLGLSIVAQVVAAHRGSVQVVDSPLGGARVEVRLPRPVR